MDFYRNVDLLGCETSYLTARGVQYRVVKDMDAETVTINFFKQHARIDFDCDDSLVPSYIEAARQQLERWSQLSFGIKTIGLRALELPDNYRLMYGPVDTVSNGTLFGDILKEGGTDIDITFTTLGIKDENIKVAIARYAAGLYVNRENVTETKFSGSARIDEAKEMIRPYMNITLC